jgi:hypothetical protein
VIRSTIYPPPEQAGAAAVASHPRQRLIPLPPHAKTNLEIIVAMNAEDSTAFSKALDRAAECVGVTIAEIEQRPCLLSRLRRVWRKTRTEADADQDQTGGQEARQ